MKKQFVVLVVLVVLACTTFCTYAQSLGGLGFEFNPNNEIFSSEFLHEDIGALSTFWLAQNLATPTEGALVEVALSSSVVDSYVGVDYDIRIGIQCFENQYSSQSFDSVFHGSVVNSTGDSTVFRFIVKPFYPEEYPYNNCFIYLYNNQDMQRTFNCRVTVYRISFDTSELRNNAYNSGFQTGYNDGLADGQTVTEDLDSFIVDFFEGVSRFFDPLMDFEIYGIPVMGVLSLAVLLSLVLIILRFKG